MLILSSHIRGPALKRVHRKRNLQVIQDMSSQNNRKGSGNGSSGQTRKDKSDDRSVQVQADRCTEGSSVRAQSPRRGDGSYGGSGTGSQGSRDRVDPQLIAEVGAQFNYSGRRESGQGQGGSSSGTGKCARLRYMCCGCFTKTD